MNEAQTISVIEDDSAGLDSLTRLLEQRGFEVRPFASAERFLRTVGRESAGCVITDLVMPGMDGRQLQGELSTFAPALSVIVVTGYGDVPTTVELMNRGAVTVLEKPVNADELVAGIAQGLLQSCQMQVRLRRRHEIDQRIAALTDEEQRIAQGMIAGTPIKALARQMRISMRTVDRRRQSVLAKMQAGSVGELAALFSETSREVGTHAKRIIRVDRPDLAPPLGGHQESDARNARFLARDRS